MELDADFLEDLAEELRLEFPRPEASLQDLLCLYLNLEHRGIDPRPRRVFRSRELEEFPPTEHVGVLDEIESISEAGGDLSPFLHTELLNPDFNDLLLNDWGLHHLHLGQGEHPELPSFRSRTAELLFVMVRPEALYFVDVQDHSSFAARELLNTVHENWPELIQTFRPVGVVGLEQPQPNSDDRVMLREAGINVIAQSWDETIYLPPGGGSAVTGRSVLVVDEAIRIRKHLRALEEYCREHVDSIGAWLFPDPVARPAMLRLVPQIAPGTSARFEIVEAVSGRRVWPAPEA